MAKVYAFMAESLEEVECITVCDILIRAGIDTELVSVTGNIEVTGSHGITVRADKLFEDITDDADILFLPGGMPGTLHLAAHEGLCDMLVKHAGEGKRLAAICAAPSVLGGLGLLEGHKFTCYPGFEDQCTGGEYTGDPVDTDGLITTGRGMGCAVDMGLELVRILKGEDYARGLKENIQYFGGCF